MHPDPTTDPPTDAERWSVLLDSANARTATAERDLAQTAGLLAAVRRRDAALAAIVTEVTEMIPALVDVLPRNAAGRLFELRLADLLKDAGQALRMGAGEPCPAFSADDIRSADLRLAAAGYGPASDGLSSRVEMVINDAERRREMNDYLGGELIKADATIADLGRRLG